MLNFATTLHYIYLENIFTIYASQYFKIFSNIIKFHNIFDQMTRYRYWDNIMVMPNFVLTKSTPIRQLDIV